VTIDENEALRGLMDTLLPGGEGFPAASATGMASLLALRLGAADASLLSDLFAALAAQGALPSSAQSWREAVARLEAVEPKLFDDLRKYTYLTYYEQPETIAAIRELGLQYNSSPLPEGYPTEPYEAGRDAPRHRRGRWIATTDVKPLDVSQLDLEEIR
jgi:hypothetical protein